MASRLRQYLGFSSPDDLESELGGEDSSENGDSGEEDADHEEAEHEGDIVETHGHHEKEPSCISALVSAFINSLLMFGLCSVHGMIIFGESLTFHTQHVGLGVKMNLGTAFFMGLLLATCSQVKVAIGGPDLNPTVFLGSAVEKIAPLIAASNGLNGFPGSTQPAPVCSSNSTPPAVAPNKTNVNVLFCEGAHLLQNAGQCAAYQAQMRATAIFIVVISSAVIALIFILLGYFRWSKYVSYVPASVMEGFLSCVGYKVFAYALSCCKYDPLQWAIGAAFGVPLYFIKAQHFYPALMIPIVLAIPIATFFIIVWRAGISIDSLRPKWMFPQISNAPFYAVYTDGIAQYKQVDLSLMASAVPDLIAMIVITVMDCLLKVSSTENKIPVGIIDPDKEVALDGVGNLVTAAMCSPVGYMQLKFNVINYGLMGNSVDRRGGILFALMMGIPFFSTIEVVNYLPRFFLSILLFFAGSGFIVENLWGSKESFNKREWFDVLCILGVFTISQNISALKQYALINAVITGFTLASGRLLYESANSRHLVDAPYLGGQIVSTLRRDPLVHRSLIQILHTQLRVLFLNGNIYFASAQSLTHPLRALVMEQIRSLPPYARLKYVIFDCTYLQSADGSALLAFKSLQGFLESEGLRLIFCNCDRRLAERLRRIKRGGLPYIFKDLDTALFSVEGIVLEYRRQIQAKWLKVSPLFELCQELTRRQADFEPFRHVFVRGTRRGLPWLYFSRVHMKKGECLWIPKQRVDTLFLVHKGAIGEFSSIPSLVKDDEFDGHGGFSETPEGVFRKGWFLNVSCIVKGRRRFYAYAMDDAELLCLDEDARWRMAREHPGMYQSITEAALKQQVDDFHDAALLHEGGLKKVFLDDSEDFVAQFKRRPKDVELCSAWASGDEIDLLVHHVRVAEELRKAGYFDPIPEGQLGTHPSPPPKMCDNLKVAFETFAVISGGHLTVPWSSVQDALMYAGIFDTILAPGDKPALTWDEFFAIGHEAAMAKLSTRGVQAVSSYFDASDVDRNGVVDTDELLKSMRDIFRVPVTKQEVQTIMDSWSDANDVFSGRGMTREKVLSFFSRLISTHEIFYYLLLGIREWIPPNGDWDDPCVTPEHLVKSSGGVLSDDEAGEMVWVASLSSSDGITKSALSDDDDDDDETIQEEGHLASVKDVIATLYFPLESEVERSLPPAPKTTGVLPVTPFSTGIQQFSTGLATPFAAQSGQLVRHLRDMSSCKRLLEEMRGASRLTESALDRGHFHRALEAHASTGHADWHEDDLPTGCLRDFYKCLVKPDDDISMVGWLWQAVYFLHVLGSVAELVLEVFLDPKLFKSGVPVWERGPWFYMELYFTLFFSVVFVFRMIVACACGRGCEHFTQPMTLIELLAILPLYIELLIPVLVEAEALRILLYVRVLNFFICGRCLSVNVGYFEELKPMVVIILVALVNYVLYVIKKSK